MKNINKNESKNTIIPNFILLNKYYKEVNEDRFYKFYEYYKEKENFKEAFKIIKKYNLVIYQNDVLFFLVEYAQALEASEWASSVNLAKEANKALKQKKELIDFLSSIILLSNFKGKTSKEIDKLPAIKEIKFITDKTKYLKINSYQLCYEILTIIDKHYKKQYEETLEFLKKNERKNLHPKQYLISFIKSLKPFINYLSKETIEFNSNNEIYSFIIELLETVNFEIRLEPKYIKDVLRPSKSTE